MNKPDVVAAILWTGATLYAVFGGADFGAGLWHLLAGRDGQLGTRARKQIGFSIGPVWEANHVWLIFCLVVLWTGFPRAFGPLMETLYVPLTAAALGIVLRGSGFAFGHVFAEAGARRANLVFAISSVLTPFFMGCVVGAVASGAVPADGPGEPFGSWLAPLPIAVGILFCASSAYIAAVFLLDDSRRAGEVELAEYFESRALIAGIVAGGVAAAGLVALQAEAADIFDGLVGEGLPLVVASVVLGLLVLIGIRAGKRRLLRPAAIGAVVAIIWAWGIAQYPFLLPGELTISEGAAVGPTLTALMVVFGAALAIVGPALVVLYRLAQHQVLE